MDVVTPCIAPVCNALSNWASPKLKNVWYLKKNMEEFRNRMVEFKAKRDDVNNHMEFERRRGYQEKEEVRVWLENYEKIKEKCSNLENQLPRYEKIGKLSRVRKKPYKFCQEIQEMMEKINMHIDKAKNFVLNSAELPPKKVERVKTKYKDGLHSVEKQKKAVFEALEDENVNVIGLWGMGGIGKTTLMYQINNELERRSNFKLVIIVTVSSNLKISDIQDKIESRLPKMNSDDSTKYQLEAARAYKLSERLKEQGNILIIFDDVWEKLDFFEIGIPENKLCKILLTTRNQDACVRMGAKEIKMEALSIYESWNLFESICFGQNDNIKVEVKNIAENVCKECAGLPLAISVVANSLKNETDIHAWHQSLKFLKEANPEGVFNLEKKVYNPIRLSYDLLERSDLKDCFLLCSLFPEDHEITLFDLICYGIGEGKWWAVRNKGIDSLYVFLDSFKQLMSRGLLQDVDYSYGTTRMHDIVRDVAINIAKENGFLIKTGFGFTNWAQLEEKEDLEGMKWISLMENSLKDLIDQPQNNQRVEFLSLNGNKELKNIHSDFFEGMQNLLLLDLRQTSISELTQCIQKLKKVQVLMYAPPIYLKISILIKELVALKNLSVLCLQNSYIQELDKEFGTLVHLRVIDFSRTSIDIIRPKVFSKLQKLEILFMHDSFCDWKACSVEEEGDSVAFAELAALMHLYAIRVDIRDEDITSDKYTLVECFPTIKHFSFKCNLDFGEEYCEGFTGNGLLLTQNTQNIAKWLKILLQKTNRLVLADVNFRNSVDALIEPGIDMHNLQLLEVCSCSNYKNVIKYSSNTESDKCPILPNLKKLAIDFNHSLDTIIATPSLLPHGSFQGLTVLSLTHCNGMRFAFTWSMAQCLVQLRELLIDDCAELKYIIENDGYNNFDCLTIGQKLFSMLEILQLTFLPKLESVWQQEESQENMKVQWPSMKILTVKNCKNLKPFIFGKQSAPALEQLTCDKEWLGDLIWEDEETENKFKRLVCFEHRSTVSASENIFMLCAI